MVKFSWFLAGCEESPYVPYVEIVCISSEERVSIEDFSASIEDFRREDRH